MGLDQLPSPPQSDRLASAYLFLVGHGGSGESVFQHWLTQLQIHPHDQVWLRGDRLTIEAVRSFQQELLRRPMVSPWHVGLIESAHHLLPEASHALLKFLEDPPSHTVCFLVAEEEDQLLPTIVSRCQRFRIQQVRSNQPTNQVSIEALRGQNYAERFRLAEEWAKRDDFIGYFDDLLFGVHQALLAGHLTANQTERLIKLRRVAETNVTRRLLAEVVLLTLGKEAE